MEVLAFEIDENGYIKERYTAHVDTNWNILDEDKKHLIVTPIPGGLFKKKWNGQEWIEGATQEEIDEMTKIEPSPPTQEEITERRLADLELMLAEILTI